MQFKINPNNYFDKKQAILKCQYYRRSKISLAIQLYFEMQQLKVQEQ